MNNRSDYLKRKDSATLMSDALAEAGDNLGTVAWCYLSDDRISWIIPKCPFCGNKHTHGSAALGSRVSHCQGNKSGYYLVPSSRWFKNENESFIESE